MSWRPATLEQMLSALAAEKATIDADLLAEFDDCWVEPYPAVVHRFDEDEQVYVVARSARYVIFFEDVEDSFCLARESEGRLTDAMDFGHLALALREMRRMEQL